MAGRPPQTSSNTTAASKRQPKVLISGASIAGPALARWLSCNGFSVTVVEKAGEVRPGGQAVDFKGPTHISLLRRMGVYEDICAAATARTDWRIVDAEGTVKAVVPGEFIGGHVEILRGDLAAILHQHAREGVRYLFNEQVTALTEVDDGVEVTFAGSAGDKFDLVVGADGVHSAIRRLAIGPEDECVVHTGYYYAVSGCAPLDGLQTTRDDGRAIAYMYSEPGRTAVLGGQKAPSLFIFKGETAYDRHSTSPTEFLKHHFGGCGWRVPAALEGVGAEMYMDELVRTRLTSFTRGRVALVGDAGYANTLGGFGTGLALMGAYVLAGELTKVLAEESLDFAPALAAFDRIMRAPTEIARTGTGGPSFLAPPSWWRIWMRNAMFANRWTTAGMIWLADRFATEEGLPEYDME